MTRQSPVEAPGRTDATPPVADLLAAQLQSIEHDSAYTLERILKESERERTELVRDAAGVLWVRKYVHHPEDGFGRQYRAISILDSPALARIHEVYRLPDELVVIMEYLEGPTVREWIRQTGALGADEACAVILDLSVGVAALHACTPPIIHRDINPNNVVRTAYGVKLIDYGIARTYDRDANRDTRTWGTYGYAAPEQFGFGQSDPRTDIYALGMLLWFLLTGTDPQPTLAKTIATQKVIPDELAQIIAQCVQLDAEKRYGAVSQLCQDLRAVTPTAPIPPSSAAIREASPKRASAAKARSSRTSKPVPPPAPPAHTRTRPGESSDSSSAALKDTWTDRTIGSIKTAFHAVWPSSANNAALNTLWNIHRVCFTLFCLIVIFVAVGSGFRDGALNFPTKA